MEIVMRSPIMTAKLLRNKLLTRQLLGICVIVQKKASFKGAMLSGCQC